jgi:hypothetical protein
MQYHSMAFSRRFHVRTATLSDLYSIKRLIVMAALAISSKLPVVYIILSVTISAPGREFEAMRGLSVVAREAVNTFMCAIKREFCQGIVIKLP